MGGMTLMWTSMSSNDNMISDMFKVALQLEEPWKLTHIEFDDQDQAWHLFIDLINRLQYLRLQNLQE
jgi:hypothetical protein